MLCLCFLGCECFPLFIPFSACWTKFIPLSLIPSLWVLPLFPICCLLTFLQLVIANSSSFCLLPTNLSLCCNLPDCECCFLFCSLSADLLLSLLIRVWVSHLFLSLLVDLSIPLSLLTRMWVLCLIHLVCCLTSFLPSLLTVCECCPLFTLFASCWLSLFLLFRVWVSSLIFSISCLLTSLLLFLCQGVSVSFTSSAIFWPLSLSVTAYSLWVPVIVYLIQCHWPLSHFVSIHRMWALWLPCLLSADLPLPLLIRVWVLTLMCPVYCLMISLLLSLLFLLTRKWVLPLVWPISYLLTSLSLLLACKGYTLFVPCTTCWSPFVSAARVWVLLFVYSIHHIMTSAALFLLSSM